MAAPSLHITVAVAPPREANIENDIRMLHAALLYADRVTLFSPQVWLLSQVVRAATVPAERMRIIEAFMRYQPPENQAVYNELIQKYNWLRTKRNRSKNELLAYNYARDTLLGNWPSLQESVLEMANGLGFDAIINAVDSGMVTLYDFNNHETLVEEYWERISGAVTEGASLPMVDDATGGLIRAGIVENRISPPERAKGRSRQAGLVAQLLATLPNIDLASTEELLAARQELAKPLVRFRAALIKYAESMKSLGWDEDFPYEAEDVFQKEVAPAVLEIEELTRTNRFLMELGAKAITKPLVPASFGLAITQINSLPGLIASGLGVASGLMFNAYEANKETLRKAGENPMFFYFRARQQFQ